MARPEVVDVRTLLCFTLHNTYGCTHMQSKPGDAFRHSWIIASGAPAIVLAWTTEVSVDHAHRVHVDKYFRQSTYIGTLERANIELRSASPWTECSELHPLVKCQYFESFSRCNLPPCLITDADVNVLYV